MQSMQFVRDLNNKIVLDWNGRPIVQARQTQVKVEGSKEAPTTPNSASGYIAVSPPLASPDHKRPKTSMPASVIFSTGSALIFWPDPATSLRRTCDGTTHGASLQGAIAAPWGPGSATVSTGNQLKKVWSQRLSMKLKFPKIRWKPPSRRALK